MTLLDIPFAIEVPVRRPVTKFGEKTWPEDPTDVIEVARSIDAPRRDGEAYTQSGQLYVVRGTDVQDGDKVSLPEGDFVVTGGPQMDKDHEMTGDDFGWVIFAVERTVR